jgi:hypothetical protein
MLLLEGYISNFTCPRYYFLYVEFSEFYVNQSLAGQTISFGMFLIFIYLLSIFNSFYGKNYLRKISLFYGAINLKINRVGVLPMATHAIA